MITWFIYRGLAAILEEDMAVYVPFLTLMSQTVSLQCCQGLEITNIITKTGTSNSETGLLLIKLFLYLNKQPLFWRVPFVYFPHAPVLT